MFFLSLIAFIKIELGLCVYFLFKRITTNMDCIKKQLCIREIKTLSGLKLPIELTHIINNFAFINVEDFIRKRKKELCSHILSVVPARDSEEQEHTFWRIEEDGIYFYSLFDTNWSDINENCRNDTPLRFNSELDQTYMPFMSKLLLKRLGIKEFYKGFYDLSENGILYGKVI